MAGITNELKAKLLAAKSAREAADILKAEGREIPAEKAERFFEEIKRERELDGMEISPDEMEAISGGEDRDWVTDGCAATVEVGSDCYGTDFCNLWPVTYKHDPTQFKCGDCGGILYSYGVSPDSDFWSTAYRYKCIGCGLVWEREPGGCGFVRIG